MNTENHLSANKLTIKGCIVGCLILVMLIPSLFIMNLVTERSDRQKEAAAEVSAKWAESQAIAGPLLVIPYREAVQDAGGKVSDLTRYAYFLPEHLKIDGKLLPEIRHRSIYKIVVYRSNITLEGDFAPLHPENLNIAPGALILNEAYICFGLNDFRGIEDQLAVRWNDSAYIFNAGLPDKKIIATGLNAPV
ncbi:MAG: inner membrane CreD family protein, partial [Sphingobacteriales bacterium]|nr:inner membrane CreD family protein [Sphingobacteriales bacterium]